VVIYGPGEARLAHQLDEWVAVSKYAIRFYLARGSIFDLEKKPRLIRRRLVG
jgi:hypothetical protein